MMPKNPQVIRRMIARLQSDPHVQEMVARNNFANAASAMMALNLNSRLENDRQNFAAQWCATETKGKWRRSVVERERHARLDRVYFDFEFEEDEEAFNGWLAAREW